ncbi:MAG: histidine phosphatase family protein [Alphaproteobacteria bacterium]
MASKLLIIRHGETTWNAAGRMQGQANSPLSDKGIAQAKAMAPNFVGRIFKSVTCSDLDRTVDTARFLGFPDARPEPLWREIHVGDWSGSYYADIQREHAEHMNAWFMGEFTPPNAETWWDFVERILSAIDLLRGHEADGDTEGTHLVIAHGLVLKAAICGLSGIDHTRVSGAKNCATAEFELLGRGHDRMLHYNQSLLNDATAMAY